ncbi:nucleoside kinase [Peribacillus sp. V2I11]|uniref:nucleoside kinase n=1 Tax=Peribacillus sp. V2I11 TaxID=3042277 RepID=UPI00278A5498|nr:nucleoside kinase [Peribacillus sp. V2I11]MDQ0884710.1 dephospho-CoA kinase [Peribacillus sp. V2I11]
MSKAPLYIITGAGASGKTFVVNELRRILPDYNVFDYDVLFQFLKNKDKVDKQQIQNIWLRVAREIAESGRTTIICGLIKPQDIEICKDFHYFSHIYYLVLHCDEKTREIRLRTRKKMTDEKIQYIKKLAKWFIEIADKYNPPMPIIDTSKTDVTKVAEQIREWILERNRID